jgi:hypothetical protein
MELWRKIFRQGFAPLISAPALTRLAEALETDDPRLLQGATTTPPTLNCVLDWPVQAACAIGYCGWQGEGKDTVGDVGEYFTRLCYETDQAIGEPAACRWFLEWADETDRPTMRKELLAEVQAILSERGRQ